MLGPGEICFKAAKQEVALDCMVLRDEQWERIAPGLPGKAGDPSRSAADNRLFLEAVLWMARVGAPWRDLPEFFGNWNFRGFGDGPEAACSTKLSKPCRGMPTLSTRSSMEPSFGFTSTAPVQRGDSSSGHRAFPWRLNDQNRRCGRCAGQSRALRPVAGTTTRQRWCCPASQGSRLRCPAG